MTRETDRQLLENITKGFTIEQSKECAHRIRSVDFLLSRVCPKCRELVAKIEEHRSGVKATTRILRGVALILVGWGALSALSIVTFNANGFSYLLLTMAGFALLKMHFVPEGPNAVAISTLKILTFTTISRIEELGASERSVFMYVREATGLNSSLLCEIRKSYLSSEHQLEDYESIVDEDDEGDFESNEEIDTSGAWERICLEISRVVSKG